MKATSLNELSTLLGPAVSLSGRLPFEAEKSAVHFSTPVRSNPLPLRLLCGDGFEDLVVNDVSTSSKSQKRINRASGNTEPLIENPALLWDMVNRWQNAESAHEASLNTKEATLIESLEAAIESNDPNALLEHAIHIELSQVPDYRSEYLEKIGLPNGVADLPKDMRPMADLFLPLQSSPETMTVKGEETPVVPLLNYLEQQGIEISLSAEENAQVVSATEKALEEWRKKIINSLEGLKNIESPTGKDSKIELILTEKLEKTENSSESDPFMDSIALLHEELPQSEEDLKTVLTALLTDKPQKINVQTPDGDLQLEKGSSKTWTSKSKSNDVTKALEVLNKAESLIEAADSGSINEEDKHLEPVLAQAKFAAKKTRLFENIEKLPAILKSLPPELSKAHKIKSLSDPLYILATQLEEAKKATSIGKNLIEGWMDTPDEKESPWGWDQAVLNPSGSIEWLCNKITGEDKELPSLMTNPEDVPEKRPSYFARRLIGEKEKAEAIERLKIGGTTAAGIYLIETLDSSIQAVKEQAGENLPSLIDDMSKELENLIEKSHTPEAKQYLNERSPIGRIIEDKTKYRLLEKKIIKKIQELSEVSNSEKGMKKQKNISDFESTSEVTEDIATDTIPGRGEKTLVRFAISKDGNNVRSNKIWASNWLITAKGLGNIAERQNVAKWVKDVKDIASPQAAIAFLEFCKHRELLNVPHAISQGKMDKDSQKIVINGLSEFKKALETLSVNTKDASIKTVLLAGAALNQQASKSKLYSKWDKALDNDLVQVKSDNIDRNVKMTTVFDPKIEGTKKIASPYLKARELKSGIDLEADIKNADPKTRLRTVIRAVSILHTAAPLDKGSLNKTQKKPKKSVKTRGHAEEESPETSLV
jgi:hypothetical protein